MAQPILNVYRKTRIVIHGTSVTSAHSGVAGSSPLAVAWQTELTRFFEQRFGADRPILINAGVVGRTVAQGTANFDSDVKFHNADILIAEYGSNDEATVLATLTTNTNAYIAQAITASHYRNGKLPRQFLWFGFMGRNDVVGEDWTGDDSAVTQRNAIFSTAANTNNWGYADPNVMWHQVDGAQKPKVIYGFDNGVQVRRGILTPVNAAHQAVPTPLGTGRTLDGVHLCQPGSLLWTATLHQVMNCIDADEPGA